MSLWKTGLHLFKATRTTSWPDFWWFHLSEDIIKLYKPPLLLSEHTQDMYMQFSRQGVNIRQSFMSDFKIYATGRRCTENCPTKCTLQVNGVGGRLTHLIYPWVHIDTKSNQPRNFRDFVELDGKEKLIPCITLFEHSLQCSSVSCNLSHLLHVKEFSRSLVSSLKQIK